MIKYTLAAISKIINDIRKLLLGIKIISTIFVLGYFAYVLITNKGIFVVNLILAIFYCFYTLFEMFTHKKQIKKTRKIVRRSYVITKLLLRGFTLGVSIYSIYIASVEVSSINIILSTLIIILWIIQVLFEVIVIFVEEEIEFLLAGVNEDIVKPINKLQQIKSIITKEKVPPYEQPYKKEFEVLDKMVKNNKTKKFKLFRNK